jgi:hypothetical protein
MHVVYGMGRLCCIAPTLVYYSKRLCLTTWMGWQVPSFIAGCIATALMNLKSKVLLCGNRKVLAVDSFAGCWRVPASGHAFHGITGLDISESHSRCHTALNCR